MLSIHFTLICTALLFGQCATTAANHLRDGPSSSSSSSKGRSLRIGLPTIDSLIFNDPNLTIFASAFIAAELNGTLCTDCNVTIFAPTNTAFGAINQTMLDTFLKPERMEHLSNLLKFHITDPSFNGMRILTSDFVDGQVISMFNSENITINVMDQTINLTNSAGDTSRIVESDVIALNGALNKVDAVFLPQFLETNAFDLGDMYVDLTTLDELFEEAGLTDLQGEYTVLAPDNEAWEAYGRLDEIRNDTVALGATLRNHIVPGLYPPSTLTDGSVLMPLGDFDVTVSRTLQTSPFFTAAQQSPITIMFNNAVSSSEVIVTANAIIYKLNAVLEALPATPTTTTPVTIPGTTSSPAATNTPTIAPAVLSLPPIIPTGIPVATAIPVITPITSETAGPVVVPATTPTVAPIPVVTPTTAPIAEQIPVVTPTIAPVPVFTPTTVPIDPPVPVIIPTSTPIIAPVPVIIPTSTPIIAPIPVPVPIEAPTALPNVVPIPVVIPSTTPFVVPESAPTTIPISTGAPMLLPTTIPLSSAPVVDTFFCIDFDCGEGYMLRENPENRTGNDRDTCCERDGTCNGVPSGSLCFIRGVESSIIPNPSFEKKEKCPNDYSQLDFSESWVQATAATPDYYVRAPSCDDSWIRLVVLTVTQNATDGDAFVGAIHEPASDYYEYLGACLNSPLKAGTEYTLNLDVAAAAFSTVPGDLFGGDTNGVTEILCIPDCDTFEFLKTLYKYGYQGNAFEILGSAAPEGGLVGGGDWKTISLNFVPTKDCPAIMIGAGASHSVQSGQDGSYVLYDSLNLQERVDGVCNEVGECVQSSRPTVSPSQSFSPFSQPPSSPICADDVCDDSNFCTIDTCNVTCTDAVTCEPVCSNTPKTCNAVSEACDPLDGICKNIESVRPCIAVIDESNNLIDARINSLWKSFRTTYPDRQFCLLRPTRDVTIYPSDKLFLPTTPDFLTDNRTTFATVNRDQGNTSLISDWFSICGYNNLLSSGIDFVGLFVDESGSMYRSTVLASLDKFIIDLTKANLTYCSVFNDSEDWITPFSTTLGTIGDGGMCNTNITTAFPTVTPFPTLLSDEPSSSPSDAP